MATAKNYDVFLGLLWAGGVHILLGFWQFLSALIVWLEQRDRLRKIYLIIATIALIINTFIFLGFSNEIAVGLFLAVVPHFLAWFYWYIVFKDHKIRKNAYVL